VKESQEIMDKLFLMQQNPRGSVQDFNPEKIIERPQVFDPELSMEERFKTGELN